MGVNDIPVATSHIEETLRTLSNEPVVVLYPQIEMLECLIKHKQDEFASVLLSELIGRVERYENGVRAGQSPAVLRENENWKHVIYALLAREAVKFDKNAALISKSGAILGMVELLLPEPEEPDDIPRAYYRGC